MIYMAPLMTYDKKKVNKNEEALINQNSKYMDPNPTISIDLDPKDLTGRQMMTIDQTRTSGFHSQANAFENHKMSSLN